jgi:hypothetical protein
MCGCWTRRLIGAEKFNFSRNTPAHPHRPQIVRRRRLRRGKAAASSIHPSATTTAPPVSTFLNPIARIVRWRGPSRQVGSHVIGRGGTPLVVGDANQVLVQIPPSSHAKPCVDHQQLLRRPFWWGLFRAFARTLHTQVGSGPPTGLHSVGKFLFSSINQISSPTESNLSPVVRIRSTLACLDWSSHMRHTALIISEKPSHRKYSTATEIEGVSAIPLLLWRASPDLTTVMPGPE